MDENCPWRHINLGLIIICVLKMDDLHYTVLLTSKKYFVFKFLKKIETIGDYVDLANDQALVKYHYFLVLSVLR